MAGKPGRSLAARALLSLAALVVSAGIARADVIYLSSGGIVKGTIVKESERSITVKTQGGSLSIISRNDIEHIEKGESPQAIYQERLRKIAPGDAEGHYQLGLWLKNLNEKALARDEFKKTILLDPEHRLAREELGYVHDRDGRWLLPRTESDDAAAQAAAKAEEKAPELKLEPSGLSPELTQALAALAVRDQASRAQAFERLEKTSEEEAARLSAIVLGPFSKTREKVAQALAKVSGGAETVVAKVPSQGSSDAALADEIKAHLTTYVEKAVRPQVAAAVRQIEHEACADARRAGSVLRGYLPDFRSESAQKRREKAYTPWAQARDEAIKTIFDLKVYPDENHGKIGQSIVDEKVDTVRAAWALLDPQLARDSARWLTVAEADAKKMVAALDDARARFALAAAWLEAKGEKPPELEGPPALDEALARYRAGQFEGALALAPALAPYEKELLKRFRDLRALEWNEALPKAKLERGKQPTAEEREQVRVTNDYRVMMGRAALEIEPRIVESCRAHSQEMTKLGYFEHESPVPANKTAGDRLKNAGYEGSYAENISIAFEAPRATHLAWYNSAPHHRNILGADWVSMGAGKDVPHWTQEFGGAPGACKR
ncbi:CAP domain-containing protein [bacterium]|nr:CAP domain-containing protein [bacterium]